MTELLKGLTLNSSGSLATMANAMLDGEFKASHPDLMVWMETQQNLVRSPSEPFVQGQQQSQQQQQDDSNDTTTKHTATATPNKASSSNTNISGGIMVRANSPSKRSTGDMRSVVIQVPPKRRKMDPSLTARRLVHEIATSATASERLDILARAKEFLDHAIAKGHDDEIAEGVDVALVKQLVLLVFKLSRCRRNHSSLDHNSNNPSYYLTDEETLPSLIDEACSALEALEMVYRANDAAVADSFHKIGPDLLHVLVTVMDEEFHRRVVVTAEYTTNKGSSNDVDGEANAKHAFKPILQKKDSEDTSDNSHQDGEAAEDKEKNAKADEKEGAKSDDATPELQRPLTPLYSSIKMGSPEGNFLILKATKIIGNLARVGKATQPMAFFPGLISSLLNLINYQPYDSIPWEARLSALWVLGNLACNPENMLMMTCTPGLVRSLVRVGCRALHADDPMEVTMEILRSRLLSSRALLNLSWKPENKIPLSENFALVELLTQLAVHRKAPALNNSRTVGAILLQTRCHAVGALRNLAAAPRRTKIHLCEYKNGHVLDALTDVALNDCDQGIQNRAFAAIHNLAVHDTAQRMVERPALVLALKDVLLEEVGTNGSSSNEPVSKEGSPRSHASATLLVLERTITPDMESYGNLRDLLDAVNPTVASDSEESVTTETVKAIEV